MNCVVLGFITGQNKNGSFYTVLNVTTQFTQYELKNGAQGKKVMNIYVPFQIPNLAVGLVLLLFMELVLVEKQLLQMLKF